MHKASIQALHGIATNQTQVTLPFLRLYYDIRDVTTGGLHYIIGGAKWITRSGMW